MHRCIRGVLRFHARNLALFLVFAAIVIGQTSRGTVTGLVTDSQKAAIPDASVDLTSSSTNVTRSTQTNESGLYRFDAVDPGKYTLQVKTTGFRTYVARQFDVGAAQVIIHAL